MSSIPCMADLSSGCLSKGCAGSDPLTQAWSAGVIPRVYMYGDGLPPAPQGHL